VKTRLALVAGLVAAVLTACSTSSENADQAVRRAFEQPSTSTPVTTTGPNPNCVPEESHPPLRPMPAPGRMPAGTELAKIQARGYLKVGVDQNTLLFGYRDPISGNIDGLDVALAREMAQAIFGSADPKYIEVQAVTTAQRTDVIKSGQVDLVASQFTVTCARRLDVDLSTVYYDAHQKVLVRSGDPIRSAADLAGRRVCATTGSTSLLTLKRLLPKAIPVQVAARSDCLVRLEEGSVDAITSDDTILLGFEIQDPVNTQLLPDVLEGEPYGLATSKQHPEVGRFVNGVLEQMRADGRLEALYQQYLGPPIVPPSVHFVPPPAPPVAQYLPS
jgi:polar amino acid transport system substrate-binding protein